MADCVLVLHSFNSDTQWARRTKNGTVREARFSPLLVVVFSQSEIEQCNNTLGLSVPLFALPRTHGVTYLI